MDYNKKIQEFFYKKHPELIEAYDVPSEIEFIDRYKTEERDITVLQALSLCERAEDKFYYYQGGFLRQDDYPKSYKICEIDPTIALFKDLPQEQQKLIAELID